MAELKDKWIRILAGLDHGWLTKCCKIEDIVLGPPDYVFRKGSTVFIFTTGPFFELLRQWCAVEWERRAPESQAVPASPGLALGPEEVIVVAHSAVVIFPV